MEQVLAPAALRKTHRNPTYQYLGIPVKHNKVFGPTTYIESVSVDALLGSGSTPGMIDCIQVSDRHKFALGAVPYEKTWRNAQALNEGLKYKSVEELAEALYQTNRHAAMFSEMVENSHTNDPAMPVKAEAVMRKLAEYLRDRDGIPMNQNEIYGDYFRGINGYGTEASFFDNGGLNNAIRLMSSQDEARKNQYESNGTPKYSRFFLEKCYEYSGRIATGYIEGTGTQLGGKALHDKIFSWEVNYLQDAIAKVAVYAWTSFEGLLYGNDGMDRFGVFDTYPAPGKNGDIYRQSFCEGSYHMMRSQALWAFLITDRYYMWDGAGRLGNNPFDWDPSSYGGYGPEKTEFQDFNTNSRSVWDINNPNHPKKVTQDGIYGFQASQKVGDNASWDAHYTYGKVWDRCDGSLRYSPFTYSVNGGPTRGGYYNGSEPISGVLGTEVSRRGKQNFGQHNMARSISAGYLPILVEGNGLADPSKRVYVCLNQKAGFYGTTTFNTKDGPIVHRCDGTGVYIP